jgi:hypothetical protein
MMSFSMRQWFRTYATVGALLLVCMVFAFLSPQAFATVDNAINVSRQIAFLVLIAVGATFVMAAGEFDLSVGAMASFAGVMAAQLAVNGTDVVVSVALTLAMCVLMGMFNGWLVGYFGVLSFITTLATGTMLSGLTFWLTGGSTVFENIPDNFSWLGRAVFLGLPGPSWVMLGAVFVAWLVMQSASLRRALALTVRYQSLISNSGRFSIRPLADGLRVSYKVTPCPVAMHVCQIDSVFAGYLSLLRHCAPPGVTPRRVALPVPHVQLRSAYEAVLTKSNLLARGDVLRMSLSQPMHVESGKLNIAIAEVTDRHTGEIGVVNRSLDLHQARPFAAEVLYGRPVLKGAGDVSLYGRADTNPVGSSAKSEFMGGARFRVKF